MLLIACMTRFYVARRCNNIFPVRASQYLRVKPYTTSRMLSYRAPPPFFLNSSDFNLPACRGAAELTRFVTDLQISLFKCCFIVWQVSPYFDVIQRPYFESFCFILLIIYWDRSNKKRSIFACSRIRCWNDVESAHGSSAVLRFNSSHINDIKWDKLKLCKDTYIKHSKL